MEIGANVTLSRRHMISRMLSGLLLLVPSAALADDTADARKAIQAAYDRANAAIARKDIKGYLADLTDDFVSIDEKGVRKNKAADTDDLKAIFPMMLSAKGSTTIKKITVRNDRATVITAETGRIVMLTPQKKQNVIFSQGINEDYWVRQGGVWKWKQSRQLSSKTTINGKTTN